MKSFFTWIIVLFLLSPTFSQRTIEIKDIPVNFKDQRFYVVKVEDGRLNKDFIGEIKTGIGKKPEKIDVEGGLYTAVERYFKNNFPEQYDYQIPVTVLIRKTEIRQGVIKSLENGIAVVVLEFEYEGKRFEAKAEIYDEVEDAFSTHEERIRNALYECSVQFNKTLPIEFRSEDENIGIEDAIEIVFDDDDHVNTEKYETHKDRVRPEKRNLIVIGYQIGGYSLIGVEYEIRFPGYVGLNMGAGLFGYTGGVKMHTSKRKNSPFFCLAWKDAGWGFLNGLAIEFGGRWIWSKSKDFGLLAQGGLLLINYIDPVYEQELYGSIGAPPAMLSLGIGLSW